MGIEEVTKKQIEDLRRVQKTVANPSAKERREEKYLRRDLDVHAVTGANRFKIYTRQSQIDADDFSCGIRWLMPSGETITLARYNGSSHVHGSIRFECHIHLATEEAILKGEKPERHAEATTRYNSLDGALACLLDDFNVEGLEMDLDGQLEILDGA